MADSKSKYDYHVIIEAGLFLFTIFVWYAGRIESDRELSMQSARFEKQIEQFEKAHHLEVAPRLHFDAKIGIAQSAAGNFQGFPGLKLVNTGRGTAYDVVVEIVMDQIRYVEPPLSGDWREFEKIEPGVNMMKIEDPEKVYRHRLVDERTIRSEDSLEFSDLGIPICLGKHIQGTGGYVEISFRDEDGKKTRDFQQFFAVYNMLDNVKMACAIEFKSPHHEKDWSAEQASEMLIKEIDKIKMIHLGPVPAE